MARIGWLLSAFAWIGCTPSSTGTSNYATAGLFAGAAGALEVANQTRKAPQPALCGRTWPLCPQDTRPVCVTDGAGCEVCGCEQTGFGPRAGDGTWPHQ